MSILIDTRLAQSSNSFLGGKKSRAKKAAAKAATLKSGADVSPDFILTKKVNQADLITQNSAASDSLQTPGSIKTVLTTDTRETYLPGTDGKDLENITIYSRKPETKHAGFFVVAAVAILLLTLKK